MAHSQLIIDILIRLSLVLVIGWLTLRLTVKLNPRWSTLISRLMITACICLPVIYFWLPSTNLAMLPPPSQSESSKITLSTIEDIKSEKPAVQNFDHKSNVGNESLDAVADLNPQEADANSIVHTAEPPEFIIEKNPVSSSDSTTNRVDELQAEFVVEEFSETNHSRSTQPSFQWMWCGWVSVSVLLLLRIFVQIKRTRRLLRNSYAAKILIQQECKELATKLGLNRIPRVHVSKDINGPCTAGLVYPVVFIPDTWTESLSNRERRAILMHEISHVAGRDLLWDFLARIMTAIWWFHPLVWRLLSRHRLACEHTSDALAADVIDGLTEYRRMLAQWTLRRQGAESNSAVLAMADRSCMFQRLRWLEVPRPCGTIGRSRRCFFILVAIIFITSFASIKVIPKAAAQLPVVVNETDRIVEAKRPTEDKSKSPSKNLVKRQSNVADIDTSKTTGKIIRVVDEKNQPLKGAKVRVGWWEDIDGDIQIIVSKNPPVTNKQGEVTIQVPKGAARAQISAEAEGYAKAGTQYSMNGEPTLTLKPGRIIHVKAIDAKGNLLPDAYPLLEDSHHYGREMKRDKGRAGYFTSPAVSLERHLMRVVDGSGEGPILFSDLIDVTGPKNVEADGTIIATLRPGIRLEGRLDDSVPRPVTDGCVELYINEAKDHRIGNGWSWQDTAFVKEDGTFVFESLPAGGYVQLFALVEGYQSTKPTQQELSASFSSEIVTDLTLVEQALERRYAYWPHLFALPIDQKKIEVELPCTPTTSIDVKVVDSIGRPIKSVQVNGRQTKSAWVKFQPYGLFIGGEMFNPTIEVLSNSSMVRHKDPELLKRLHGWAASTFMKVITDANGVAHVKNLPPQGRQSYSVIAPGYMMPVFPASIDPFTSLPNRYAVVDLSDGEKLRRTITMEKHFPISGRKIMVVNRKGEPVSDINVTVSEIAFKDAPNDWELWASQRFGPIATGKTGGDGLVRLRIPLSINNHSVARLQVVLQGKVGVDAYVRKTLIIPRLDDGRVVVLTVSDKRPKNKNLFREVEVDFLQPSSLLSKSPQKLLEQLLVQPSLIRLNRLLKLAKFDAATPLRFRSDLNWIDYFNRKEKELGRVPVVLIPTDQGIRVIVLCDVRPKNAAWEVKPELRSAPSAAFVFDATDGSLIKMIGGWASSKGSYNNIMLTNQGGTDDYFISTSAFEEHGPFKYIQRWYRVGHEMQPALTVHNYANGTSRDAKDGPSDPLAEFGYIQFSLNGKTIDHKLGGILPNGAIVPRKIYWDGLRNQFIGPVTQSFDGKPLYQVVSENSAEFVPLEVKPGEMVIGGGRRYYQNWHGWDVVVPEGKTARLRLFLLDLSSDKPVETEIKVLEFNSGLHSAQLQFTDTKQDTQSSTVEIRVDSQRIKNLKVPRVPISNAPSVKGEPVARVAKSSADLFSRETIKKKVSLIWQIKLE